MVAVAAAARGRTSGPHERARPRSSSRTILIRVAAIFRPYRRAVLGAALTVTASALIGLAPPLLFASIIDNIHGAKDAALVEP